MQCQHINEMKCPKGHIQTWKCHESPPLIATCPKCERATKLAEKKKSKALALQQKRDAEDLAHAQRLADLEEKIAVAQQDRRDRQLAEDRTRAIEQKEKDLETALSRMSQAAATPPIIARVSDEHFSPPTVTTESNTAPASSPRGIATSNPSKATKPPSSLPAPPEVISPSQKDWQRRKEIDGASNDTTDSIMELIGLEEVKMQVLRIYAKIEVTKRQGTSLKGERFNIVLLGNPGTGLSLLSVFFRSQNLVTVLITA